MSQSMQLWAVLSPEEQRQFLAWLDVFYAGKKQMARKLAAAYQQTPQADEASCLQHLYPGQAPSAAAIQRLRHIQEELSRLLREFLALLHFRQQEQQQTLAWLAELKRRQASEAFDWFFRKAWKSQEGPQLHEQDYYDYRIRLGFLAQEIGAERGMGQSALPDLLRLQSQQLAYQYAIWQLYLQNLSRKRGGDLSYPLGENFEAWIKQEAYLREDPLIKAAREMRAFVSEELADPSALIEWFEEKGKHLSSEGRQTFYTALLNGIIRQYNRRKDEQTGRYLLRLYRQGIESGWLSPSGTLPPALLRNFVHLSIRIGQAAEAYEQLLAYGKRLHKQQRDPSLSFCRALLLRSEGQWSQAISAIQGLRFEDRIEEAHRRLLLLWLYRDRSRAKGALKADEGWLRLEVANLKRELKMARGMSPEQRSRFLLHLEGYMKLLRASRPAQREALRLWTEEQRAQLPYDLWFDEALQEEQS